MFNFKKKNKAPVSLSNQVISGVDIAERKLSRGEAFGGCGKLIK